MTQIKMFEDDVRRMRQGRITLEFDVVKKVDGEDVHNIVSVTEDNYKESIDTYCNCVELVNAGEIKLFINYTMIPKGGVIDRS